MTREPENLMLNVLREIRDEARQTNVRLDQTNGRLDQTIDRLDQTNARIDANSERIDANGARIDHLAEQMVRGFTGMHERLDRLDRRFEHFLTGAHGDEHRWLQRRVERIESHLELEPLEH